MATTSTAVRQRLLRLAIGMAVLLAAGPALLAPPAEAQTSADTMIAATVLGAPSLNIRSCPELSCDVAGVAPNGGGVMITGEVEDGFVPVTMGDVTGYALALYVVPYGDPAPFLTNGAAGCNRVAIVFNIGVGYEFDYGIIDTLEEWDVPATMFPMGWWAELNPEILEDLADRGYPIGHHGDMPIDLPTSSDFAVIEDMNAADATIRAIIGDDLLPYFTPYAASMDERVRGIVSSLGYLPVGWDLPANDYAIDADPNDIWARIVPNIFDGAIIEMHIDAPASAASTGVALPWVIDALTQRGYEFVTIPELSLPCGMSLGEETEEDEDVRAEGEVPGEDGSAGTPEPSRDPSTEPVALG